MSRASSWILIVVLLAACKGDTPALDLSDIRQIQPKVLRPVTLRKFTPPATPPPTGLNVLVPLKRGRASRVSDILFDSGVLSAIARDINSVVRFPRSVNVSVYRCGFENAMYDPDKALITLCEELVERFAELFADIPDDAVYRDVVIGASVFVFLHEIGHALIGELGIHNIGNGENVADHLATVLLIGSWAEDYALHGAESFLRMAEWRARTGQPVPFWDEHGPDESRFFEILCLVYGSNTERYGFLLAEQWLPWDRAQVCPSRWREQAAAVQAQLAPHAQPASP
ncbi:MAG: hypothetical protein IT385_04905 [Deltaproteobacteria bacterium]|nr:hypothetical protein [Deltaproteobacteria bacterium]